MPLIKKCRRISKKVLPTLVAVMVMAPLIKILSLAISPDAIGTTYRDQGNISTAVDVGLMTSANNSDQLKTQHDLKQSHIKDARDVERQWGYAPLKPDQITIIGNTKPHPGFLTIGIPTVCRKVAGTVYLGHTIDSLLSETRDKENTLLLVFAADADKERRRKVVETIQAKYGAHLDSGLIQIMQVSSEAYPPLEGLKRNYNDNADRVKWRAKQVVDFAFMFYYGSTLSKYYVQIEDDVLSTKNFDSEIKKHIESVSRSDPQWVMIDFSELGFIGKLFRSSDLGRFSRFLMMFYQEMPVDWLLTFFHQLLAQNKKILRKPTLFQHMGEISSFTGKGRVKVKDRFYGGGKPASIQIEPIMGKNPPADVCTTVEHYKDYIPVNAYNDASDNFFWGKKPKENDTFTVVFKTPKKLKELYIESGHSQQQNDYIRSGFVMVSSTGNDKCVCTNFQNIGEFAHGKFVSENMKDKVKFPVKCIQIVFSRSQEEWVIIREITPTCL